MHLYNLRNNFISVLVVIMTASCNLTYSEVITQTIVSVKSGLEVFLEQHKGFPGKKTALMTNQSAVNHELVHASILLRNKVDLQLLLSPEHGIYGADYAGDKVREKTDIASGIRTVSTYRANIDQIVAMLDGIDIVFFDVQDIGVRSYTFIYSMSYLMKAAAKSGIKVVVLDRPNPITGTFVEGNVLEPSYSSGVGRYPLPYRHGMTIGELALMFNTEFSIGCDLEVVKMRGWTRDLWFDETDLPWIPTSPHVPDVATIMPMITTGTFGELHTLSEGVGITIPFEFTGGPWIKDPFTFARTLQQRSYGGVTFRPTYVKPYYGRHKGKISGGVQLHVTDRDHFKPYLTHILIMIVHQELYPDVDLFANEERLRSYHNATGTDLIQKGIQIGLDPLVIEAQWQKSLKEFMDKRKKYLLYK